MGSKSPRPGRAEGGPSPAAVVVPTHEHLTASTADGAVRLIAVIVVLIRTLQEAVLESREEGGTTRQDLGQPG